jgi:hypothetical protein
MSLELLRGGAGSTIKSGDTILIKWVCAGFGSQSTKIIFVAETEAGSRVLGNSHY